MEATKLHKNAYTYQLEGLGLLASGSSSFRQSQACSAPCQHGEGEEAERVIANAFNTVEKQILGGDAA